MKPTIMRRKVSHLYMLLLSALLSLLGFGSCKTLFFSKKKQAQQREAFVRDSIEKAGAQAAYEAYRLDSIRKVKEMEQNICIYGGPDMMDRRVRRK